MLGKAVRRILVAPLIHSAISISRYSDLYTLVWVVSLELSSLEELMPERGIAVDYSVLVRLPIGRAQTS
jgi:hypothetical protein